MNLFSFTANFTDEESCRLHFKEERDKQGVSCKRCSGKDHYWLKGKCLINVKLANSEPLYVVVQ